MKSVDQCGALLCGDDDEEDVREIRDALYLLANRSAGVDTTIIQRNPKSFFALDTYVVCHRARLWAV